MTTPGSIGEAITTPGAVGGTSGISSGDAWDNLLVRGSGSAPPAVDVAAAVIAAAAVTPIHADAKKMNGADVQGDGTVGNQWRGNV